MYALPHVDDYVASLGRVTVFFRINIFADYQQLEIDDRHIDKAAFTSSGGRYILAKIYFGSDSASETFQQAMRFILVL